MPAFNAERYIALAVESVLSQTFADFEFIIIDDGSTDATRSILESYAARDTRVRLVSRPNTGYATALNEAIGLARGEFVARMDSDDVSDGRRFERQVTFLWENTNVVAVGGQAWTIDSDGDRIGEYGWRSLDHETIDGHHLAGGDAMIIHPSAMIRRSALNQVGGYRTEFEPAEDLDLWLRLAEIGGIANLGEHVLEYRLHLQSVSHTRFARQASLAQTAANESRARRGLEANRALSVKAVNLGTADYLRFWARNAYVAQNYRVARKHAFGALREDPISLRTWRMLCGILLGRFGRPLYLGLRRSRKATDSNSLKA
jgi:glycosyltransferase involved in cell wall biosynthesis